MNFLFEMKRLILRFIAYYRVLKYKSPLFYKISSSCLYQQNCSKYAYHCINRFGILKGVRLSCYRIYHCTNERYSEELEWAPKKLTE